MSLGLTLTPVSKPNTLMVCCSSIVSPSGSGIVLLFENIHSVIVILKRLCYGLNCRKLMVCLCFRRVVLCGLSAVAVSIFTQESVLKWAHSLRSSHPSLLPFKVHLILYCQKFTKYLMGKLVILNLNFSFSLWWANGCWHCFGRIKQYISMAWC